MEKTLKVEGMHCKSCEMLLNDLISEIKGIETVVSDHKKGLVVVTYSNEASVLEAKKTIEKEGYTVVL